MTRSIGLERNDARHRVEIERTIDVRKQFVGLIGPRLVADLGPDSPGIQNQQDESALARVESLRDRDDLRGSRAMDEAIGIQTRRGILTCLFGRLPSRL